MMPTCRNTRSWLVGILRAGLVVVNVTRCTRRAKLEHQLKDSGAKLIVILENFAATLQACHAAVPSKKVVVRASAYLLGFQRV